MYSGLTIPFVMMPKADLRDRQWLLTGDPLADLMHWYSTDRDRQCPGCWTTFSGALRYSDAAMHRKACQPLHALAADLLDRDFEHCPGCHTYIRKPDWARHATACAGCREIAADLDRYASDFPTTNGE